MKLAGSASRSRLASSRSNRIEPTNRSGASESLSPFGSTAASLAYVKLGWKPDSVKAGDVVSVDIHPLKTGGHGGQLLGVVLPSGQKLGVTGKGPSPFGE